MKDFIATNHNLQDVISQLQEELVDNPTLLITTQDATTGKWGLSRLWRMWVATVSDWAASSGVTMPYCISADGTFVGSRPFNADDGHELFTANFMGADEEGNRLSWARSKSTGGGRVATKGERFHALRQLEQYATERGIALVKPRDSEYTKLEDQQSQ